MARYCDTCGARLLADQTDCACGAVMVILTEPSLPADEPMSFDPQRRREIRTLSVFAVVAVAVVALLAFLMRPDSEAQEPAIDPAMTPDRVAAGDWSPSPPAATSAGGGGTPIVSSATATCSSPPGQDASGAMFSYDAEKVLDGRPDTAWRCDGDGSGQTLTLRFVATATVTELSVIPGFAKVDPYDGTDRYTQGRRIAVVAIGFDDGTTFQVPLDAGAGSRAPQIVRFEPRRTGSITVTVVSSVPGSPVGGKPPTDKIAISELVVG
ncbi:MAG TPA: discoidin domain-containing protein [Actinokineospora sp.]|nr:discoidin domain-containing protein [Actinokineospora sp.]